MKDLKRTIEETVQELKQERDELRVKVRLAKMEANEEWEEIEAKIATLESKVKQLGHATAASSKDIGAAAKLLGEEIRNGFKKLAGSL